MVRWHEVISRYPIYRPKLRAQRFCWSLAWSQTFNAQRMDKIVLLRRCKAAEGRKQDTMGPCCGILMPTGSLAPVLQTIQRHDRRRQSLVSMPHPGTCQALPRTWSPNTSSLHVRVGTPESMSTSYWAGSM